MAPEALFKCLADETRLRAALLVVSEGELCVCELVQALDESQPKVSRHLAQLRACGLLRDRRQGLWIYYRVNPTLPEWVHAVLHTTAQANAQWLAGDLTRLQHMGDRPVRAACC
ncbi:metalloregulator ArsR/SmtB family transcription factor [Pseudomonas turukhanskensis]|uniref:Transcriptional regulator n=1 Tax=Pseudomonas turukhanskensis TaxID=1806536 RepID=A0A9W6K682_9PSED|nr:metalloregulator ArsR/SmtB family transcription factor [Pseudomonas turukhanskensis]GLK90226.1 transcriptional regulator [Pseudomonas turukhanskensis]